MSAPLHSIVCVASIRLWGRSTLILRPPQSTPDDRHEGAVAKTQISDGFVEPNFSGDVRIFEILGTFTFT